MEFILEIKVPSKNATFTNKIFYPHKKATGWYGMNMADIRRIEAETKALLDKERATGEKRGHEEAKE